MFPLITASISLDSVQALKMPVLSDEPGTTISQTISEQAALAEIRKERADAIDAYYAKYDMPLEGYGMKMVLEAEKNDIDWRLLPAISIRESTGGKKKCTSVKNSHFGFGSCKISFESTDKEIEIVARNLGGNNPKTAHHYDGKTTEGILKAYNPPSVVAKYSNQVMAIMEKISPDVDA